MLRLDGRGFVGGLATALGTVALSPETARAAEVLLQQGATAANRPFAADDHDSYAKLAAARHQIFRAVHKQ